VPHTLLPQAAAATIRYTIEPKQPAAHLFEVTVTIDNPSPMGQRFMLPVWIPGSYMVREFARHIVQLTAMAHGQRVACRKVDKATWQCAPCTGPLTLTYEVYACDLSVRGAHLDDTHAFFNGACVFLLPEGLRDAPCALTIAPPANQSRWKLASAFLVHADSESPISAGISTSFMPKAPAVIVLSKPFDVVLENYDALIDHPVEMGDFAEVSFEAHGTPHHIIVTGAKRADLSRLAADFKKFCEAQISLFEPDTRRAPFPAYWFLIHATPDGFGGLEHRASTALLVGRDDLPLAHEAKTTAGYRKLLSLASHEYFHAWNVKRIAPAAFMRPDFARENYTTQLWFFEGFTDYYDDLMLARAGLITALEYLEVEAENIGRVTSQSGRFKQSLAESSFDAWVKYYRQDENAPNAIVSYYAKGAIVGLALDLTIRSRTDGKCSLDDVMRALWNDFGKRGPGVAEGDIERVAAQVTGLDLGAFFADAVYGTKDIDLAPLFKTVAIDMTSRMPGQAKAGEPAQACLGARIGAEANGDARLAQVLDGGSAQAAGLSAYDVIIAIDGLRVNAGNVERRVKSYLVGSVIELTVFRQDALKIFRVTLAAQPATVCALTTHDEPATAKAARLAWLGADVSASKKGVATLPAGTSAATTKATTA
jgi:predicted metalloprotease with PDZ domain